MPADATISVACGCGKRLKAPASAAGRRAKCPACSAPVLIPQPDPPAADSADDALYELAAQAESAPVPTATVCPQCRTAMPDTAVLCTHCGYNTRTGKSVAAAVAAPPPPKPGKPLTYGAGKNKPVDYMAPSGSLVLGIVLSAVFALAASLVWIVIAFLTGFTIGYIALLIGVAAGIGMQVGHRGYSKPGGVIAAGMTLVAIFTAKFVVLFAILAHAHKSFAQIDSAKLGLYFFSPIGLIIICVGVGAAYKAASGISSN
jgi:hypothetical protein